MLQDEQTALILAARCNHFECVKVLIAAHANVNAKDVVCIKVNHQHLIDLLETFSLLG